MLGICSVGNPSQFNYDVRSSYQKITVWGGLCGNRSNLGLLFLFLDSNVNGMSYLDVYVKECMLKRFYRLLFLYSLINLTILMLWWIQDCLPVHY